MSKRKGFTLIEMLVVVLIIGILAAIAFPQYEKVVEKSHAAEGLMIVRTIADAEKVYYLATGKYTSDLTALDFSVPGISFDYNDDSTLSGITTDHFTCRGYIGGVAGLWRNVLALCKRLPINETYAIAIRTDGSTICGYWTEKGRKYCSLFDVDEVGPKESFY